MLSTAVTAADADGKSALLDGLGPILAELRATTHGTCRRPQTWPVDGSRATGAHDREVCTIMSAVTRRSSREPHRSLTEV